MKKVLHISTECYPAAKAGGMGDVVGALPIYLPANGIEASVIIPKYANKWFSKHQFKTLHKGSFKLSDETIRYQIQILENEDLGYPFYCVDIPGKFDRESIYLAPDGHGYPDEAERNIAFQTAICEWLSKGKQGFDGLHCHDHMAGLTTFFIKYCPKYKKLADTPTFFTIHNGQYRGIFDWEKINLFPDFDRKFDGMLDWDGRINSLAASIKCAWQVNTVSPSYMEELSENFDVLTSLIQDEKAKTSGILNGIDPELWNPTTDKYLNQHLEKNNWTAFKSYHKNALLKRYGLKSRRPLMGFIGRMAPQKGADVLAEAIEQSLKNNLSISFIILGSGDKAIEENITRLAKKYPRSVAAIIAYDEGLSRHIYAGCDFLIMPSLFEPCGLNQLYSMRYGTVPVVTSVGGLKDTVPDISVGGNGIAFPQAETQYVTQAIERCIDLYKNKKKFTVLRDKIVSLDYSWNQSAKVYADLYSRFLTNNEL